MHNLTKTDHLLIGLLVFFFIFGHVFFMSAPFVNLESWYATSAIFLYNGEISSALENLETAVANPLGFSFGVVPFYWVFGVSEFSSRLLSLFSSFLVVAAVCGWTSRRFGARFALSVGYLMSLNPLFWLHSGLAYADVPFLAMLTLSFICLEIGLRESRRAFFYTSAALFGGSALIKYNAFGFTPVIAAWILLHIRSQGIKGRKFVGNVVKTVGLYFSVVIIMTIPYGIWMYGVLGHLLHPMYVQALGLSPRSFQPLAVPYRFFAILMWFGIFVSPIFPYVWVDVRERLPHTINLVMLLSALASPFAAMMIMTGRQTASLSEMRLGWGEFLLRQELLIAIMSLCIFAGSVTVAGLAEWSWRHSSVDALLGVWFFVGIFIHAFVRPTMRYTLFVLPPLVIYLSGVIMQNEGRKLSWRRKHILVSVYIVAFCFLNVFNSAYLAAEGHAASRVANYVNEKNLKGIHFNPFNSVQAHSGYLIDQNLYIKGPSEKSKYEMATLKRDESVENVVYDAEVKVLGIVFKRYVVLEKPE
ncbi:MAG: ArnT family glycosyltransferase [Candidatus Methylomirabilales bacterium]